MTLPASKVVKDHVIILYKQHSIASGGSLSLVEP